MVSAIGGGIGTVFTKKGMLVGAGVTLDPVSAALMRLMPAGLFVLTFGLVAGKLPELRTALDDRKGIKYTAYSAFIGPFVGLILSMVAIANTLAGVAQTLISLRPVFIIPMMWLVYKEKTSWRGIIGAFIAVVGVAILFLT